MSKFLDILNGVIPQYSEAMIIPITDPKITVIESNIDGDPSKDWMVIRSPYFLGEKVVTEYAAEKSGLETWWVVSSYPHCVGTYYEWRLRR